MAVKIFLNEINKSNSLNDKNNESLNIEKNSKSKGLQPSDIEPAKKSVSVGCSSPEFKSNWMQ